MYHRDLPEGKIFETEEELDLALREGGWVDSPGKIGEPIPIVDTPKLAQAPLVNESKATTPIVSKKPGRPPKKFTGGK
jgi:hypothetical protein